MSVHLEPTRHTPTPALPERVHFSPAAPGHGIADPSSSLCSLSRFPCSIFDKLWRGIFWLAASIKACIVGWFCQEETAPRIPVETEGPQPPIEEAEEPSPDPENPSKLAVLLNIDGKMRGGMYQGVTFAEGTPDPEELKRVLRPLEVQDNPSVAMSLMHLEAGDSPQAVQHYDFEISRNFPGCERYEGYKQGMRKWMLEELALPLDLFRNTACTWIRESVGPENYSIEAESYKAALLMRWKEEIRVVHFDEIQAGLVPAFCEAAIEELHRAFQYHNVDGNGPLSLTLVLLEEGKQHELFIHRNVLKSSVLDESGLKSSKRLEPHQEKAELERDFEGCATDPIERDFLIRWFLKRPVKG